MSAIKAIKTTCVTGSSWNVCSTGFGLCLIISMMDTMMMPMVQTPAGTKLMTGSSRNKELFGTDGPRPGAICVRIGVTPSVGVTRMTHGFSVSLKMDCPRENSRSLFAEATYAPGSKIASFGTRYRWINFKSKGRDRVRLANWSMTGTVDMVRIHSSGVCGSVNP